VRAARLSSVRRRKCSYAPAPQLTGPLPSRAGDRGAKALNGGCFVGNLHPQQRLQEILQRDEPDGCVPACDSHCNCVVLVQELLQSLSDLKGYRQPDEGMQEGSELFGSVLLKSERLQDLPVRDVAYDLSLRAAEQRNAAERVGPGDHQQTLHRGLGVQREHRG
jgi:hypothetical protein